MSASIIKLIEELRAGADMSVEGAGAIPWRVRIRDMALPSVSVWGAGIAMIGSAARTLLLQRGQVRPESDAALCGVLVEIANILELEARQIEERKLPRSRERDGRLWWSNSA